MIIKIQTDACHLSSAEELKGENVNKWQHFIKETGLRSDYNTRIIWDIKLVLTKKIVKVESIYDPMTDKRVTAEVNYTPPGGNILMIQLLS